MCSISVNSPFGFMMINMSEWRFMSVAGSFCGNYKNSYVNIICFMCLLHAPICWLSFKSHRIFLRLVFE